MTIQDIIAAENNNAEKIIQEKSDTISEKNIRISHIEEELSKIENALNPIMQLKDDYDNAYNKTLNTIEESKNYKNKLENELFQYKIRLKEQEKILEIKNQVETIGKNIIANLKKLEDKKKEIEKKYPSVNENNIVEIKNKIDHKKLELSVITEKINAIKEKFNRYKGIRKILITLLQHIGIIKSVEKYEESKRANEIEKEIVDLQNQIHEMSEYIKEKNPLEDDIAKIKKEEYELLNIDNKDDLLKTDIEEDVIEKNIELYHTVIGEKNESLKEINQLLADQNNIKAELEEKIKNLPLTRLISEKTLLEKEKQTLHTAITTNLQEIKHQNIRKYGLDTLLEIAQKLSNQQKSKKNTYNKLPTFFATQIDNSASYHTALMGIDAMLDKMTSVLDRETAEYKNLSAIKSALVLFKSNLEFSPVQAKLEAYHQEINKQIAALPSDNPIQAASTFINEIIAAEITAKNHSQYRP